MDLFDYRASEREQQRMQDLLNLLPQSGSSALDVGARDGHLSRLLINRFERVVALDIQPIPALPSRVEFVQGDIADLQFQDNEFEAVVCAEVLEHIPPERLPRACSELARVARSSVIVGVPFRQDLRCARTTCVECGGENPPWGHVNSFDNQRLAGLFSGLSVDTVSYVGSSLQRTNALSAALMSFAGNPFGTYGQDEPCIHCGASLKPPPQRSIVQRLATRAATIVDRLQNRFRAPQPNWIHVRFSKQASRR